MALSARFVEAMGFAAELHRDQVRKGTCIPYLAHLLGVASIALEHGADEDEAIAALLHDAVEDQGGMTTREAIRKRFGERVASIVDGCTDSALTPKPPWRARKEAYLEQLASAPPSVRLVSLSDKLHNVRSLLSDYRAHGEALWDRFSGGRDGTLWYYRALVEAHRAHQGSSLLEDLDQAVTELEALAAHGAPPAGVRTARTSPT